ncbi:hypothetical protein [Lichenihabitans psoromatis]|uniref:hypothetical protein n=1 Tax=Lichenihabitans psoromatis TaxID=2528642 RepID=UPI00103833A1|nr:hypothetical protein [Lichenihabitans psoromatis]
MRGGSHLSVNRVRQRFAGIKDAANPALDLIAVHAVLELWRRKVYLSSPTVAAAISFDKQQAASFTMC